MPNRPTLVELLAGGDAAIGQVLISLRLRLRVGELSDITVEVCLNLSQRRLERPPV